MKDTYLNAKLVEPDLLRLVVFSSLPWERIEPVLLIDGVPGRKMKPTRLNTLSTLAIADFRLDAPLELGHSYFFVMPQYGGVPVDVSEATRFPGFDEHYYYDGDDLGATYSKKDTRFALWAPLASRVVLAFRDKPSEPFVPVNMVRTDKGVYRAILPGDHELAEYHYFVTNSEVTRKVTDPYAKASALNGEESVVADFNKLKVPSHRENLPLLDSYTDAVIYETHVRDMTVSPDTDIVHKGAFLGMVEKGRKTKGGHPAGLDHLLALGVTHIQLLPIYDYKSVDEAHPGTTYNWGYDPAQYFVPEGSYASKLSDPYSRIIDCKKMISAFHESRIRVIMDVVYNHVYEYESSVFEAVVPNFYFRHKQNGKMANTSGCGDDLASERPMVRKMIVDACRFWIEEYGIDGFRFDLMGILDVETLNQIAKMAKAHDKSFILYGEGWNMGGEVHKPLGHMGNYRDMPDYGFFNDWYRESFKRLLIEDRGVVNDCKNLLCGSCVDFIVGAKFLNANQTINYVECHDNATLFDFLSARRGDLSEQEKLRLVQLANLTILSSFGVPFFHMGQEIGLTKFGEDNTYNKGDHYNQMDYGLLDSRYPMVETLAKAIRLRKKLRALHVFDPRVIMPAVNVYDEGEVIRVNYVDANLIAPLKTLDILINPSPREYRCSVALDSEIEIGEGRITPKDDHSEVLVPGRSLLIVTSK